MRINNIIRRSFNFPLDIETVTYAITYKCNSQCMMCNIWKNGTQRKSELSIKEVNKLFRSELLNHLKGIQITGGEPFIRKDLPEVINAIEHEKVRILISTNGYIKDIPNICDKIKHNIRLAISIDGIGDLHDNIRGVQGAYEKAITTAKELINRQYDVTLGMTAVGINDTAIITVKEFADSIGAGFGVQVANIMPGFISNCDKIFSHNIEELKRCLEILKRGKPPTEKMFYDSCLEYLSNPEKRQRCYSGYNSFFLDPYGTIYKCVPDNKEFGNIRNNTFKSIWEGVQAQQVRDSTCPNCVLGCEFGNTAQYSPSLLKYKIGV